MGAVGASSDNAAAGSYFASLKRDPDLDATEQPRAWADKRRAALNAKNTISITVGCSPKASCVITLNRVRGVEEVRQDSLVHDDSLVTVGDTGDSGAGRRQHSAQATRGWSAE
jgi:hypothetical protein